MRTQEAGFIVRHSKTFRGRATLFATALLGLGFASLASGDDQFAGRQCEWTQWGRSSAHDSQSCAKGQWAETILAEKILDPFIQNDTPYGSLDHVQVPLSDGEGRVFIMAKTGVSGQPQTYVWSEKGYRWQHDRLVEQWSYASDWKPAPLKTNGTSGLWQPALSKRFLYLPGAGGTLLKLDKQHGGLVQRINPFGGAIDPQRYVVGGVTADQDGNIVYNVLRLDASAPRTADVHEAWLVRVDKHGQIRKADYTQLIPNAPAPSALCYLTYTQMQPQPPRPWPPAPQPDGSPTLPPQTPCLSQRPPLDATPAIAADGTIYAVTRAHAAEHYGYLVALTPGLQLKWASSLRGHLNDGCGVLATVCRPGATHGVDPLTNMPPAGVVNDSSSSSPVALPDGSVVFGAYTVYNAGRGHLMKFDREGQYQASYDFGWDITPGVYRHGRTYSLVIKDQYYADDEYAITQLSPTLEEEWEYTNTNTQECERLPDGTIECEDIGFHFEWCVATPGIDRDGNVYAVSADGNLYVIGQGGILQQRFFLERTAYAAYTPTAIDHRGRIYPINNGKLFIVGRDR
ncbi:MAG TPA: hypothetical protein VJ806_15965 [Luteimonas sp.]|nr:hypothetical protein [Luteimonas sp.]